MNSPKPIKLKRCIVCKQEFPLFRSLQKVCSPACAIKAAQIIREKQERKELREAKQRIKPLKKWLDEAQAAVNKWVREVRDRDAPCISCGRYADSYDAGHYRSRGAASHLRFNLDNLHKQCSRPCNHDLSGNIVGYRMGLIKKIGLERVEALETDNTPHKWTIEEARQIKTMYTELWKYSKKEEAK